MIDQVIKLKFPDLDARFRKVEGEKLDEAVGLAREYLEKFCE